MMGSEIYIHVTVQGRDVVIRTRISELTAGVHSKSRIRFGFVGEFAHLFDPASGLSLV